MFSATGNLLPGSYKRPDIVILTRAAGSSEAGSWSSSFRACRLNRLGYCPLVSTITGLGRVLLGIIHTIVHLVKAIFDKQNRVQHIQEAWLGAKNIARGMVEAIPIINLTLIIVDEIRAHKFIDQVVNHIKNSDAHYEEPVIVLSAYGKELAEKPEIEINTELTTVEAVIDLMAEANSVVFC